MSADRKGPISTSEWARNPEAPATGPRGRGGMTREQIVTAAVELLDTAGVDGLSMRKLGALLGSGTTSVYWYVASKDELLDLALDAALGEVRVPALDPEDWRSTVASYVRDVRTAMLTHAWIPSVIGHRPNAGPNAIGLSERILASLEEIGFPLVDAARASSALTAYALGSAVSEVAWRSAIAESGMTPEAVADSYTSFYASESDAHPVFSRWWAEAQPLDLGREREDAFEFGLKCQLDGLQTQLERSAPSPRERPRRRSRAG